MTRQPHLGKLGYLLAHFQVEVRENFGRTIFNLGHGYVFSLCRATPKRTPSVGQVGIEGRGLWAGRVCGKMRRTNRLSGEDMLKRDRRNTRRHHSTIQQNTTLQHEKGQRTWMTQAKDRQKSGRIQTMWLS